MRKLELSCGIATVVVAMLLSLFVLKFDWDASLIVEQQFVVFRELSFVLLLFIFPGVLVAGGSYAHAAKRKAWGRLALALGCVAVIASVLFVFAVMPMLFATINAWSVLSLSFLLATILTLILSFTAREKFD